MRIGYGFWLVLFVVIKLAGSALAAWSWLWVLLPIVPIIVLLVQKAAL